MACQLMKPIFCAAEEIKFTETEEGFFVEGFLISNKLNANGWMVTREANKKDGHEWKGQPDIFFMKDGRMDHTTGATFEESTAAQEPFRVGTHQKVLGLEAGTRLSVISKIEDPEIQRKIRNKEIMWTSPAVFPRSMADVEIVPTGPNSHIHILHRYRPLHRAFVDEPAYGKGETQLGLTCEGKGKECLIKLEQLKAGIGDSEIDPLRTIPLKVSKCSETGNVLIELKAGAEADCVSRILSEKLGPGEEPTDQDLAIAFSECRKSKSGKSNSSDIQQKSSTKQMGNEETTEKKLEDVTAKMAEMEEDIKKALKGQTENEEEEKARKAKAQEEEEKQAKKGKKGKKGQEDTPDPEKTAQEKEEEEKAQEEEQKKEARMASLENKIKIPIIKKFVAAKMHTPGFDETQAKKLEGELMKASLDEVEAKWNEISPFVGALNIKPEESTTESSIGYGLTSDYSASTDLEKKSTEELLKEAGVEV